MPESHTDRCDTPGCEWRVGHLADHPCGRVVYDYLDLPSPDEVIARLYSRNPGERPPGEIVLAREVERLRSSATARADGPFVTGDQVRGQ